MIPCHYNTFPPIETDAQAFKSDVESATSAQRRRARAGRDALDVTHAIVLLEAERSALATLGGELADIDGVAEAYSVTGEWDFVAILRLRDAGSARAGRHGAALAARRASCGRRRWSPSRSTRATTSRRCSRSGSDGAAGVSAHSCAAEMHAGERLRLPLVLDRAQWLERLCAEVAAGGPDGAGEVAHLGCADSPYTAELLAAGALLHTRLVGVAPVTGIDVDGHGLELLRRALPAQRLVSADVTAGAPERSAAATRS